MKKGENPRGKLADGLQALTSALFILWRECRVSFYYQYNNVIQIWSALTERNPGQSLWWTTKPLPVYSHKHAHFVHSAHFLLPCHHSASIFSSLTLSGSVFMLLLSHLSSFSPSLSVCLHPRSSSTRCRTCSAVTDISRHYPLAYICALDFCK